MADAQRGLPFQFLGCASHDVQLFLSNDELRTLGYSIDQCGLWEFSVIELPG